VITPVTGFNRHNDLASSLKTTVTDLTVFTRELLLPTLISENLRNELLVPVADVNSDTQWASGFGIDLATQTPTYWHWGANPGFQSLLVADIKSASAVVVLTNTGGLMDYFSDVYGGHNLAKEIVQIGLNQPGRWDVD